VATTAANEGANPDRYRSIRPTLERPTPLQRQGRQRPSRISQAQWELNLLISFSLMRLPHRNRSLDHSRTLSQEILR